jgi:hypothetical protein
MSLDKTIYIWDGGVFSPPTRAVGKLAYNIAKYISSLYNNKLNVEYHFVPSNKYYNKPWVRCVEEDDRIHMLKNLVTFINKEYSVPKNIKFVVNDYEIILGKKRKEPITATDSITYFKNKKNLYISNTIETIIQRVKGHWYNSLNLFFDVKNICYDIYSADLIGVNQSENYVYKSINLSELLRQADGKYPKEVKAYLKKNNITNKDVDLFIRSNKDDAKFNGIKDLIMKNITFLPKHLVPHAYKAIAGNRVREELDVFYSSLNNIQKLTTPGIEEYITSKHLYEHCKSTYKGKLVSKSKKSKTSHKSKSRGTTRKHYKDKKKNTTITRKH